MSLPDVVAPTSPGIRDRVDRIFTKLPVRSGMYAAVFGIAALGPSVLSPFWVGVLPRFMVLGIFALSLDLLWGYSGLLSFGQGAFLGIGAYSLALLLQKQGPEGAWLTWVGIGLGILLAVVAALALGYFMFYGKVSGVFFGIITLSVVSILQLMTISSYSFTGGENGVTGVAVMPAGIPWLWEFDLGITNQDGNYYMALFGAFVAFLFTRTLVRSPAGQALLAVKANEARTEALGYNVRLIKVLAFATSAGIGAFAGALYAPLVLVNPQLFQLPLSVMAIVFVALGGRGTLVGAFVGALVINSLEQELASSSPELWRLTLGLIFIGAVMLFPRGIMGGLRALWRRGREVKPHADHLEDLIELEEGGAEADVQESVPTAVGDL